MVLKTGLVEGGRLENAMKTQLREKGIEIRLNKTLI